MSKGFLKWSFVAFPLVAAGPAHGETLRQALIYAYRTNPSLTAARAGLRATDEGVPIAKAAARPTLSATPDYQEFVLRSANSFSAPLRSEEQTSELQSLMRTSYAVFCLKKQTKNQKYKIPTSSTVK